VHSETYRMLTLPSLSVVPPCDLTFTPELQQKTLAHLHLHRTMIAVEYRGEFVDLVLSYLDLVELFPMSKRAMLYMMY